jgi:hypothetical protein
MPVTRTSRFSLHRWDSGADPFNRSQMDTDNLQVEILAAAFRTGLIANIGDPTGPSNAKSFYYATDTGNLYFCTGTVWVPLSDFGEAADIRPILPNDSTFAGTISVDGGIRSAEVALADHRHAIATAEPIAVGTVLGEGNASSFARSNHVHILGPDSVSSTGIIADGIITAGKLGSGSVTTEKILDGDVTAVKLDSDVAGPGLVSAFGVLSVNVDASTIEINSDTLRLKDGGVTLAKLAANSVDATKIVAETITADKFAPGAVSGASLNEGAVTAIKIATDAVTTIKILNGNVTAVKLAPGSVTTEKILDSSVTALKLAPNSVTTAKITDGNVFAVKLAADVAGDGLTSALGVLSVNPDNSTLEINADAVRVKDSGITAAKLGADAVTTAKILDGNVVASKLNSDVAGNGLTTTSGVLSVLVDNSTIEISSDTLRVKNGGITAVKLNSDVAGSGLVSSLGVLSVNVDSSTIEISSNIARVKDLGITAAKLAADSVTTAKILNANVTLAKLASASVDSTKLAAGVYYNATASTSGGKIKYGTAAVTTLTGMTAGDLYFKYV